MFRRILPRAFAAAVWAGLSLLPGCGGGGGGGGGSHPGPPTRPAHTLAGLHLVQATQDMEGTLPLVAGREALLRVFVTAPEPGLPAPAVRVKLAVPGGGKLQRDLPAPADGAPVQVRQGDRSLPGTCGCRPPWSSPG